MVGTANAVNGPEAAPYLAKAGGTMTGNLILNTSSPSTDLQAASKGYVDTFIQGLNPKPASAAATTVALTVTYNNGSSGVGATLTNAGAMAAFSVDGYSAAVGDVILIKDQASTFENGLYTVTTVGSGAANWVLTRSTSMDAPSEFKGGYTFVINGTVNSGRSYVETAAVATVGTDAVTFAQFSQSKQLVVNLQTFTSNNTYTPTTGLAYCVVEGVGAGGGSGGSTSTAGQGAANGGGGSGGYFYKVFTAANIGANAAVVIGAAGTAGASGLNTGGTGGNTTFTPAGTGGVLTGNGGVGSVGAASTATSGVYAGGAGGTATGGDINITGGVGSPGFVILGSGQIQAAGIGGGNLLGSPSANPNFTTGGTANNYGAGASGQGNSSGANQAGLAGAPGFVRVLEFCLQ